MQSDIKQTSSSGPPLGSSSLVVGLSVIWLMSAPGKVGKVGHTEKDRQTEARAPWGRQGDAQIHLPQAGQLEQKGQRQGDGPNADQQLKQRCADITKAEGLCQTGPRMCQPHKGADQQGQQAAPQQIYKGCRRTSARCAPHPA